MHGVAAWYSICQHVTAIVVYEPAIQQVNLHYSFSYEVQEYT